MYYNLDMEKFWDINKKCMNLTKDIPRVPVSIYLNGDWICEFLKLNCILYYSNYRYQQDNRLKCNEITEKELGYRILPAVDFGVVMDASIYGGKVNYEPNATPTLQPVVNDPGEIEALIDRMAEVDLLERGLIPKYLEWRERIKTEYGMELTYGDEIKGCATILGQICGITNFLTWIATHPEQIQKLISCWLETSKRYLQAMRRVTGFPPDRTGFSIFGDLTGMLSPQMYRDFIMEAEKALFDLFAPDPGDRRFYHADYHMQHHLDTFRAMGINQVNIDPYIEPGQILSKLPEAIVYGQIPPTQVLLYGTPEEVAACAKRDIQQAGPGKHLVLSTAGSINPGTSFENLRALCYAAERYGCIY